MTNYIPIFPEAIDNSMRKVLVKCEKAAHYKFELGLEPTNAVKVDLHAGGAYADGMKAMRRAFFIDGKTREQAVEIGVAAIYDSYGNFQTPPKSNKSVGGMAGALVYYEQEFPLDKEKYAPMLLDGRWMIEVGCSFGTGLTHPVTGKEIEYAFNFDCLALDADDGKSVWVVDEKTTSQMGDKWANQWFLDAQMTGYCWAARRLIQDSGLYGQCEVKGAIINGVAIRTHDYSCLRLSVYRQDWELERWWTQVTKDIYRWINRFEHQNHNQVFDHACAHYLNPCEYAPLCSSRNPERLFDGSYVQKFWDPRKVR